MENEESCSNRQNKVFQSTTGRRYGRQYAYLTYRPMNSEKSTKSLPQSKNTVDNVALEYAHYGEPSPRMKKKDIKKSASKVTSDGSHSGSGINSPSRSKDKEKSHHKKRKGSGVTATVSTDTSSADIDLKMKHRTKKTGPRDGGNTCSRYENHAHSSDRNWNSEGGKPKSSKKGSAKQNCDSRESGRQNKKPIRRKRAVSTSEKQEFPKHVKHGAKSCVASTSGASSSSRPQGSTSSKSRTTKDSPRSSSSGPEAQTRSKSTSKTRRHRSKSSHRKSKDDNLPAASANKNCVRKKAGKSKRVGSESRSRLNPAVDSVASLPALGDSSDSESDMESRMIAEEYVRRCRYINQEPSRNVGNGLVYQMITSIMTDVMFGDQSEGDSDSSIESREDFMPELVPLASSYSSGSSERLSDRSHSSLPSLSTDTNSDSDLSESSSSGSHSHSSHGNDASGGAACLNNIPPLISDSNSEDSEHTAEEMSDMEEEEEFYRAAAEVQGAIEDALFPFIQLPSPVNPLELIIQNRIQYTQEVMQSLFENTILRMLAMHPDLQGDQAPAAATQETINSLPQLLILPKHIEDELSCAICQCEYKVDDSVNKLPCDHMFHPMCITAWLQKSGTCPVCRHILNTNN